MNSSRLWLATVVGFAQLSGCGGDDAAVSCPGSDAMNCEPDATVGCTGDMGCSGATPVCEIPSGTCVECTSGESNACTGTTPVCSAAHACTGCTSHEECPASNVCLPSGACADATDVAYVSSTGTGTTCTQAAPCPLLASAVATGKATIKIAANGAAKDPAEVVIDGKTVTILAAPGATLSRDGVGPILEVRSGNANVTIYDLHITGASGTGANGVVLTPNGGSPALSLVRVKIDGNQGAGITASGGALTVSQSTISQNTAVGIVGSGGTLTVSQSTISQNTGGGITVANGTGFDITNCFVYRNGNQDSGTIGGINIDGGTVGSNRIAFNTIVDNRIGPSGTKSGGLLCDIVGLSAPNNIIARNQSGSSTTTSNAQTLGACSFPTSKVQPDVTGLNFASAEMAPYSYKLTSGNSAIDAATTTSTVDVDFDGDSRPQGAAKDIGADEYKP